MAKIQTLASIINSLIADNPNLNILISAEDGEMRINDTTLDPDMSSYLVENHEGIRNALANSKAEYLLM